MVVRNLLEFLGGGIMWFVNGCLCIVKWLISVNEDYMYK